jgi:hypothetical protein
MDGRVLRVCCVAKAIRPAVTVRRFITAFAER